MDDMVLVHDPGVKESRDHFEQCKNRCKVLLWDHDKNTENMKIWQDKYGGAHKFPYYLIKLKKDYKLVRRYHDIELNILKEESVSVEKSVNKYFDFLSFDEALNFKQSASSGLYVQRYLVHKFPEQTVIYRNCFPNGTTDERKKTLPSFHKTIRFFEDKELEEYKKIHQNLYASKSNPTVYTNNVVLMPEQDGCDIII